MLAWTLGTATPARRASSQRSREVSRTVPEEKMRPAGCRHGEDVAGVGDQDVDSVGGVLEEPGHEFFQDPHIGAGEVQPGLAGRLLGSGRDDDDVGALRRGDVAAAGHGRGGGSELGAVGEVQHLGFSLGGIDVEQGDVAGRTADQGGVGKGGSHAPGAHNRKFGS
jgi:hypothetical protein